MPLDGDVRVEPVDHRGGAVNFGQAEVGRGMDHLPLQIRQRHDVVVDHAQRADARRGEVKQRRCAKAAGANHQRAGAAKRGLSRPADLAQHDVARVTFQLRLAQHGLNISANSGRSHPWAAHRLQ